MCAIFIQKIRIIGHSQSLERNLTGIFDFNPSQVPLLVSIPHAGTLLPPGLRERFTAEAGDLPDTDWFVDRLYRQAADLGAGVICARYSRYVVDLNRPPDDAQLYAGKTTGLVPVTTFSGQPVYRGEPPGTAEIEDRTRQFHEPYHRAIGRELQRLRNQFGYALLLDAHSICSEVPMLFDGRLPDLNLGSFDGRSADPGLVDCAASVLRDQAQFTHVLDGRFKGGYITRFYGKPDRGVHTLQLEIAQSAYMQENPPRWDENRAKVLRPMLRKLMLAMRQWGEDHGAT